MAHRDHNISMCLCRGERSSADVCLCSSALLEFCSPYVSAPTVLSRTASRVNQPRCNQPTRTQNWGSHRRGFWLRKGLVVKIMAPELKAQGLFKKKGSVVRLVNDQVR